MAEPAVLIGSANSPPPPPGGVLNVAGSFRNCGDIAITVYDGAGNFITAVKATKAGPNFNATITGLTPGAGFLIKASATTGTPPTGTVSDDFGSITVN